MKWGMRQSAYTAVLLLVLIALVLAGAYLWLRTSLPQLEGEIDLAGLAAPVRVERDSDGVVTLRAENLNDAYRALGFVHAQDRLWQMDFMRRTGTGRLSEVVGEATLDIDRFLRTLGFYQLAEANLAILPEPTRSAIDAYTAGINAFIDAPGGPLPLEFHLLGYRPEPWKPADSLIWGKLMAFQLSGNWRSELRRARLAGHLPESQIDQLWTPPLPVPPVILSQAAKPPHSGPDVPPGGELPLPWPIMPKDASNSWVLSGSRTDSGKPILANDLHLALDAPGLWYLARIETPDATLTGATAPGVPFLVAGHNGHIAWGFTTTHADTQDLFIEKLGTEPDSYVVSDGEVAFERRQERIAVDGSEARELEVRLTRNGPVLNDVSRGLPDLSEGQLMTMAWPALRPDDRTVMALHGLNQAKSWAEAKDALRDFHAPLQNVVVADSAGNTAFMTPGRVPLRRAGDGRRPVPGWDDEHAWDGFIPFDALPRVENPDSGYLVNANNRIIGDDYPHLISADWPDPARAVRIAEVLQGQGPFDIESMGWLQNDALSEGARRILPRLLAVPAAAPLAEKARARLASWDFVMDRRRAEPLIFSAWIWHLNHAVFADELGGEFLSFTQAPVARLELALAGETPWCDDVSTGETESCDTQIGAALATAVERLQVVYGEDMADWAWGKAHVARFPHPVLSRIPVLGEVFGFAVETDGGEYTVNRGGMPFGAEEATRFEHRHGATFRALYDLADLDNSRFMIATGQSGNPLSPYYGSLAERWRDGEYLKLVGDKSETRHELVLLPATN